MRLARSIFALLVDIAPTLATLLPVHPTERLDGAPIGEVLHGARVAP